MSKISEGEKQLKILENTRNTLIQSLGGEKVVEELMLFPIFMNDLYLLDEDVPKEKRQFFKARMHIHISLDQFEWSKKDIDPDYQSKYKLSVEEEIKHLEKDLSEPQDLFAPFDPLDEMNFPPSETEEEFQRRKKIFEAKERKVFHETGGGIPTLLTRYLHPRDEAHRMVGVYNDTVKQFGLASENQTLFRFGMKNIEAMESLKIIKQAFQEKYGENIHQIQEIKGQIDRLKRNMERERAKEEMNEAKRNEEKDMNREPFSNNPFSALKDIKPRRK